MSIKRAEELEFLIEKIKKAFGVQNYETAILQSKQKTHDVHTKNMLFLTGIFVELGDHLVEIYKRINANDFLEDDSCVFAQILAIQVQLKLTRDNEDHVPVIPDSPINIIANPPRELKDDSFEQDLDSWLQSSAQKSTYEPDLRNFALRVAYWARGWAKKNLTLKD